MAAARRLSAEIVAAATLAFTGRVACGSLGFDGAATARAEYGDLATVTIGNSGVFSCFCVVRHDTLDGTDRYFFGKLTTGELGWQMGLLGQPGGGDMNRVAFRVSNGPLERTERYHATEAVADTWYTVGGSYAWNGDGTGDISLYVDGVDNSATPVLSDFGRPAAHTDPLTIGGHQQASTGNMQGKLGHVAVWDGVVLSAAEHAKLAAGADPRTIRPAFLTFYGRLEEANAIDWVTKTKPTGGSGASFDVDRWPGSRPFIVGLGDPTPTSMKVMSHAGRPANHVIEYSLDRSYSNQSAVVASDVALDYVVVHQLTGLTADSVYNYRVLIDDAVAFGSESTFRTAPDTDETTFRFVHSACTEFERNSNTLDYPRYSMHAFEGVDDRNPNFAIHGGDLYYADRGGADADTPFNAWAINTVEAFIRKVTQLLAERDVFQFTQEYPVYMIPDDHEFVNNADELDRSTDPADPWPKALDRVMNWEFQKNPARTPGAVAAGGLWYTASYGGVDFFFLDMRTQRGINGNPGTETMLGNTLGREDGQLGELLAWLDASTASFKVVIGSGMLSDHATNGSDSWKSAFPDDQQNVIDALATRRDVVYLAGDAHWSGVSRLAAGPTGNSAHDLYEFIGGVYGGPLSDPPDPEGDLLFTYDGDELLGADRMSYLVVDVDTVSCPASMSIRIISHDPTDSDGDEDVEYTHPPILSRSTCQADATGDCIVGIEDLLALLGAWGTDPGGPPDLDDDGDVGITDFLALLAAWGPCR